MRPKRIVVVDDERLTRETLVERLCDEGYQAEGFANGFEALESLAAEPAHAVITDLRMPSMDGTELHRRIRDQWPETAVLFITAFGTVSSAVEAMREGAADYLTKPLNTDELMIRLRRLMERQEELEEIRMLRREAARRASFGELIFQSARMAEVVARAMAVADTDITVVVQGETGTGKEVLCRAIHGHSLRDKGPFVAVNCAGLNPNLLESELFGHEPGAFTGATRLRRGRLEAAHRGTLFIDEIDDLSMEVQVRLLRFLQDRTFERVGSSKTRKSDVRVLCATKKNLEELVVAGEFREDLYYRVNAAVITLPPLRERREDIPFLAEHFRKEAVGAEGGGPITPEALKVLLAYDWPGNVRELRHAIQHAVAFARGGAIGIQHLPAQLQAEEERSVLALHLGGRERVSLPEVLSECERRLIDWALSRAGGNQGRAAQLLSIPRTTLRSRLAALAGAPEKVKSLPEQD